MEGGIKLDQKTVIEFLDYNEETGKLFWKKRDLKWFKNGKQSALHNCNAWNKRYAGKLALNSLSKDFPYLKGSILGKQYSAHRIIWLWKTGDWPKEIDHENKNKQDNRWINLRVLEPYLNSHNKFINIEKNHVGVDFIPKLKKWRSRISIKNKQIHIGLFDNREQALLSYDDASKKMLGEYGKLNFKGDK